jgi:hypothetical protein
MKPDLQFTVLCDDVRREDNGKFMLIGLFEVVGGPTFPMTYPVLRVVNRWCNGEGDYRQRVRLVSGENVVIAESQETDVKLHDTMAHVTAVTVFGNIVFPKPGKFWVEVLLNGDLKQRFPLIALEFRPEGPFSPPGQPPFA